MPPHPFDNLCQLLSRVVSPEDSATEKILSRWLPEEWEAVIGLASRHLVLPSIAARLSQDHTYKIIDPSLHQFFQGIHFGNTKRNLCILSKLDKLCKLANKHGIRPIILKGGAYVVRDIYWDLGARYLSDIDVLVGKQERDLLRRALRDNGYTQTSCDNPKDSFWDDHHHAPPLLDPDGEFVIEIHSDTLKEGSGGLDLGFDGMSNRALDNKRGDVSFRIPCMEDLIVHSLAHNQLGHNYRFIGLIEMRDLLDLHFLTLRGPCSNHEWASVLHRFERAGYGSMVSGFLNALKTMVPKATLGQCPAEGVAARWYKRRYLRRYHGSLRQDPTIYADLVIRELHRLWSSKSYRRRFWRSFRDIDDQRQRWRNLRENIWRSR